MQSLSEVYNNLSKEYKLEWIDDKKQGFYVYISNGRKEYRLNVYEDYIGIEKKKNIFKAEFWDLNKHIHIDNKNANYQEIYNQVLSCIRNIVSTKDTKLNIIRTCFQKSRISTILLIFSLIVFAILAPIAVMLSTNYGIIYSLKLLIPIGVLTLITILTYKDKIKEKYSKIITIILFIILGAYLYRQTIDCIFGITGHIPFVEIIGGYNYKEEYYDEEGWQDFTDYCKYYYDSKADKKFKESSKYKKVENEDISNIIEYFYSMDRAMEMQDRADDYDFNIDSIDNKDYVYMKKSDIKNYSIYFYDIQTHILYYIHRNI